LAHVGICECIDHTWAEGYHSAQKRLLLRFFGAVEAATGQSRYVDVRTAVEGKSRRHHLCCCGFNLVKQLQIHRFIQRLIPRGVGLLPSYALDMAAVVAPASVRVIVTFCS